MLVDGIAVVAYLESTEDPLRVQVWLINQTDQAFDVVPEQFTLQVLQPAPKALAYVSPAQIKKRIDSEAAWAAAATAIAGALSTTTTSGTVTVTDSRGRTSSGSYSGRATTRDSAGECATDSRGIVGESRCRPTIRKRAS
jgi:hypothetical protein